MTTKHTVFQWLRWPLMPIASVFFGMLAAFIVWIIVALFEYISARDITGHGGLFFALMSTFLFKSESTTQVSQGLWHQCVVSMLIVAAFSYVYSLTAYLVSPRGKKIAVTVMLTISSLMYFLNAVLTWLEPFKNHDEAILATANFVALLTAGICAITYATAFWPDYSHELSTVLAGQPSNFAKREGLSIADAIEVKSNNSLEAVFEEYSHIAQAFGNKGEDWQLDMQSNFKKDGKRYDSFDIKLLKNNKEISVYFDVSKCFAE